MARSAQQQEVDRNYDYFQRNLSKFLAEHRDQYALLKDQQVVAFYSDFKTALADAQKRFGSAPYSLQQITDEAVDLGFWSHALL